jgi:hypothetical protein
VAEKEMSVGKKNCSKFKLGMIFAGEAFLKTCGQQARSI